jgi:hypothetical protein
MFARSSAPVIRKTSLSEHTEAISAPEVWNMAAKSRSKRTPITGTAAARSRDRLTERSGGRHEGDRPRVRASVPIALLGTCRVPE